MKRSLLAHLEFSLSTVSTLWISPFTHSTAFAFTEDDIFLAICARAGTTGVCDADPLYSAAFLPAFLCSILHTVRCCTCNGHHWHLVLYVADERLHRLYIRPFATSNERNEAILHVHTRE